MQTDAEAPGAVLDTNIALDWLVFADVRVQAVVFAVENRRLRWLACPAMRIELAHMLGHRSLAAWNPDATSCLATFDRMAELQDAPAICPQTSLRCSDADDQVFIALALASRAQWLFTHDRALLKLARRAARQGLRIVKPDDWTAPT